MPSKRERCALNVSSGSSMYGPSRQPWLIGEDGRLVLFVTHAPLLEFRACCHNCTCPIVLRLEVANIHRLLKEKPSCATQSSRAASAPHPSMPPQRHLSSRRRTKPQRSRLSLPKSSAASQARKGS